MVVYDNVLANLLKKTVKSTPARKTPISLDEQNAAKRVK
jgi:hypothetical protein